MLFRPKAWQLPLLTVLLCAGVYLALRTWRARLIDPAQMVQRFPGSVSTILYFDVAALNASGILPRLAGRPGGQEADYQRFVDETAFDYQRDLRSLMLGFAGDNTYVLANGVFDWNVLRSYAEARNGICRFSICRMPAYSNGRAISWAPFHKNVIALAIGADQWGAAELTSGPQVDRPAGPPSAPVWISSSGKALRSTSVLPDGTRMFTRVLEPAGRILITVQPNAAAGLEVALSAECAEPAAAGRMSKELADLTATLNAMLVRENRKPNPADLSGILAEGKFQAQANRVTGRWPLPRPFMDTLLAQHP